MAVRYRRDRKIWVADIDSAHGRYSRHFKTEQEAVQYEMLVNKPCLARLHSICSLLDWHGKDPGQKDRVLNVIKRLGEHLHPRQVSMQVLDEYVAQRKAEGRGSSTIRAELSALKVMLTRAIRLGWINALPLFPENRTLPLPEARDLVLQDAWFAELLAQFERREQRLEAAMAVFIRQTGCRADECLSLTWDRVDFRKKTVQFVLTKGVNARRLPMDDRVENVLRARQHLDNIGPFPSTYTRFYARYKSAVKETCSVLGLGLQVQREWVIHTLRHTRITELAMKGASAPQIQQWAGHKDLSTSQKYIHAAGINLNELVNC